MYPEGGMPKSKSVKGLMDDLVKVDALAIVLTEAIQACQKVGGGVDPKDVGAFVLRCMLSTGAARPRLSLAMSPLSPREQDNVEAAAVDMMAAEALGKLITRAIEKTQEKNGLTHMQKVAVYVLRAMKEARH
jgi:hypothetical protein